MTDGIASTLPIEVMDTHSIWSCDTRRMGRFGNSKKNSLLENRRMKKIGYSIIGAIFLGGLCIGITWLLGALFGPLYHGEEESSRNFGIFLYSFFAFLIGGAIVGYVIAKK
jgi:hypothetical protein